MRYAHMTSLSGRAATGALATALALGSTAALAPQPVYAANAHSATAQDTPAGTAKQQNAALVLAIGESRVVNLPGDLSDVMIADPSVADVHVRSQRQFYIIAKAPGETNIFVTSRDGKMLYANAVRVGNNLTSIGQMLTLAMPQAKVKVATMNGMILLTGTVAAPEDAAEVERLVQAFVGKDTNVVSRLRTATPLQVNLQVRIAEVNKTLVKSLGFNLLGQSTATSGFQFGLGQGTPGTPPSTTTGPSYGFNFPSTGTTLGGAGHLLGLDLMGTLNLAENEGLATTLANPNLTALSGETASFLAGGEIPIPIATSLGNVSVQYKQYGVSLAFTPTVLADGRISMRVRPEVSQLDTSASVKLNGYTIPGISTRRAETTVELGSGQSFMIGGLLSSSNGNTIDKAPFLGDLPIIGNLFKSKQYTRKETELVIIVTPYLVKPVNARQIAMPTDGYRNATDVQSYLGDELHDGQSGAKRPVPTKAPPQTVTPEQLSKSRDHDHGAAAPGFSF